MDRINEFNVEHGVYKCGGLLYVPTEVVTHEFDLAKALPEPLVVVRSLEVVQRHVNGRLRSVHERYVVKLSEFKKNFELQ